MKPPALSPRLLLLLCLPPLLWAGNAVVGRALIDSVPPILLNTLRWVAALALLLPFVRAPWREPGLLSAQRGWWLGTGLLGMGAYNTLQYQALHSSSAVNVTLIAASMPLAMMLVGRLVFGASTRPLQWLGALLSGVGVLVVIAQGQPGQLLQLRFVQGDLLMLLATLAWAGYSWLLTRRPAALAHWSWIDLLATQMAFGLLAAIPLAGLEQLWTAVPLRIDWGLVAALAYIVIGPSLLAYRCWALGVAEGGPALASFFVNLTPLFAALLSAAWLGEAARPFHALAFALIAAGIAVSAKS